MSNKDQLLDGGPFPERMDMWAEHRRFFHGLHEQMIGVIIPMIRHDLYRLGYFVGRELSLQIADGRIPDVFIKRSNTNPNFQTTSFPLIASEMLVEPGIMLTTHDFPTMTAIKIKERQSGDLVTVIEVISPGNKLQDHHIADYINKRQETFLNQGVNVIEIDITRSYKRLVEHPIATDSPYHVATFIPEHGAWVVPMALKDPFKRIALPLRNNALPLDLQDVYSTAYRQLGLANLLWNEGIYTLDHLPFASLLSQAERDEALAVVQTWQDALQQT